MSYKPNKNLEKSIKEKLKVGLERAAIILQNEVKDNLSDRSGKPQVRTGNLRRSIQVDISESDNLKVRVGTNSNYAAIQEFGGVVKAKTAKALKFKIDGLWKSVKSVILTARPYFRPALKSAKDKMLNCFKGII